MLYYSIAESTRSVLSLKPTGRPAFGAVSAPPSPQPHLGTAGSCRHGTRKTKPLRGLASETQGTAASKISTGLYLKQKHYFRFFAKLRSFQNVMSPLHSVDSEPPTKQEPLVFLGVKKTHGHGSGYSTFLAILATR